MKNPKSDSHSVEETGEESQQEFSQTQLRLNYVLFLLPSSTPIIPERNSNNSRSEESQRISLSKYLSSPDFPSFNVNILSSDSESSQDECDLKVQSKTRSGRIYKTV